MRLSSRSSQSPTPVYIPRSKIPSRNSSNRYCRWGRGPRGHFRILLGVHSAFYSVELLFRLKAHPTEKGAVPLGSRITETRERRALEREREVRRRTLVGAISLKRQLRVRMVERLAHRKRTALDRRPFWILSSAPRVRERTLSFRVRVGLFFCQAARSRSGPFLSRERERERERGRKRERERERVGFFDRVAPLENLKKTPPTPSSVHVGHLPKPKVLGKLLSVTQRGTRAGL